MSIRSILENSLATITPTIGTIYQNAPSAAYTPVAGTPYQIVSMMYGGIEDLAITNDLKEETGIMQVDLMYPLGKGSKAAEDRARLIRSHFTNALKLTDGTDAVTISKTCDFVILGEEADRFRVSVSVFWKSYTS